MVAEVIAAARGRIVATMAHEAGKTIDQADPEVSEAVDEDDARSQGEAGVSHLVALEMVQ